MQSKQTTNDCEGKVSKKFVLEGVVGLQTLGSEMSVLLLAQNPRPLSPHPQFFPGSHGEVHGALGRSWWQHSCCCCHLLEVGLLGS